MDTVYSERLRDTIYQTFGSRRRYVLPFDALEVATDSGEGGVLRCFNDDKVGLVEYEQHPFFIYGWTFSDLEYDCDQLSSISSIPTSNAEITVFPNPASSTIQIQSDGEEIRSIILFNIQGIPILEKQGNVHSLDIGIGHLPSGMYFVLINEAYYEKVIVER